MPRARDAEMTIPDIGTEEKRKKTMRALLKDLRRFQKSVLKSHGEKPLPSSVADLNEIREGR